MKAVKSGTTPSSSTISEPQLQSELDAFKKLDLNDLTSKALIAKCVKGKLLPKHLAKEEKEEETMKETYLLLGVALKNPNLKGYLLADSNQDKGGNGEVGDEAEEKVKARLTSSKILAEETSKSVENLSRILGLNLEKKPQDSKSKAEEQETVDDDQSDKKKKSKKDEQIAKPASSSKKQSNDTSWMENRSWSGSDGEDASEGEDYQYVSTSKSKLPVEFESQDEDEDEEDGGGEDDEEKGSDFGEEWNALVAPPSSAEESEVEDDDEDSTDSEEDGINGKNRKFSMKNKLDKELPSKAKAKSQPEIKKSKNEEFTDDQDSSSPESDEESESESDSGSESDSSTKNLPTLSSGFIQSGLSLRQKKRKDRGSDQDDDDESDEESEWSDAEADLMAVESDAEEGGKAKGTKKDKGGRKNRMGQRARKA